MRIFLNWLSSIVQKQFLMSISLLVKYIKISSSEYDVLVYLHLCIPVSIPVFILCSVSVLPVGHGSDFIVMSCNPSPSDICSRDGISSVWLFSVCCVGCVSSWSGLLVLCCAGCWRVRV